jgi:hypothetical protein
LPPPGKGPRGGRAESASEWPDAAEVGVPDGLEGSDSFFDGERGAEASPGISVARRLVACRDVWHRNTDDMKVLESLDHGFKLPFWGGVAPPKKFVGARNFSADEDLEWVRKAVKDLVDSGAAMTWDAAREELAGLGLETLEEPWFVMPLLALEKSGSTPDNRKLRLCHDCRAINEHLDISRLKFKLSSIADFAKSLRPGDRLISTDLASAYHHVGIHPAHWKYLGFEFDGTLYVYCVLPFGLNASAGFFCRFSAVAASMVRASGLISAAIVYIDDFGFALRGEASEADARAVFDIIRSLGFALNEAKTVYVPDTRLDLLGFIIDTVTWRFEVPERRLIKLESTARAVQAAGETIQARELARLAGQILAMQTGLGLVCRVRSRFINLSILPAARAQRYNMIVPVLTNARREIDLWADGLRSLPFMPLTPHRRRPDFRLEADASATAAGARFRGLGREDDGEIECIHRELSEVERRKSSTLRELLGYAHAVNVVAGRHGERLRGKLLEIMGDSQAARAIFNKGGSQTVAEESGDLELFEAFLAIFEAAARGGFEVAFRWVPREEISLADALSKYVDRHDFGLTPAALERVRAALGPWDIDRFAAAHNATAARFNSLFDTAGAEAVDAFSQSWAAGVSYILHDFLHIMAVMDKVERDDAEVILIIPEWRGQPFWRRFESGGWAQRVVAPVLWLEPADLVPHPLNAAHCFFGDDFKNIAGFNRNTFRKTNSPEPEIAGRWLVIEKATRQGESAGGHIVSCDPPHKCQGKFRSFLKL